jgi:hypothetical protein
MALGSVAGLLMAFALVLYSALLVAFRLPFDVDFLLLLGPLAGGLLGLLIVVLQARRTSYGVTDRRVVSVRGTRHASMALQGLFDMTLKKRSRGRGHITFPSWPIRLTPWEGLQHPAAFEHVEDAHRVYTLIQDTARASRT